KYGWTPGKGVRTVCEVFTHIAAENYDLGKAFGGPDAPKELANVSVETCLGDKAKVQAALKTSFEAIQGAVRGMKDADLDGSFTLFGAAQPRRAWLMATAEHAGEHLGQLIAYARMNQIVPPWSK
ncbi:MAG: DinB family protein, partial [Gemmatimonadota bacterium]|nr:DinB family protein [Gemmatimonadota bacterium]